MIKYDYNATHLEVSTDNIQCFCFHQQFISNKDNLGMAMIIIVSDLSIFISNCFSNLTQPNQSN